MAQNIYDDPEFFAAYGRLERSRKGLDGAPEWPAISAILPDLSGKRVADLGCGFGWFARWARQHGAAHVLGLDLSEKMIARARRETPGAGIDYEIADLETLELPGRTFDFAYSSLAFHYIADFARLMTTVHHALKAGSELVFTIEHPIYMAPRAPRFAEDGDGKRSWALSQYSVEGPRSTDWLADGVIKYHRTLGTTLNALVAQGFEVRHVDEWSPSPSQLDDRPSLADEIERPMLVIIKARK